MADERPLRLCDSCGQVDRDPRHVYAPGPDSPVNPTADFRARALELAGDNEINRVVAERDLADVSSHVKHFDCCLADGCPDGVCSSLLEDSAHPFDGGKTTGAALVKKLEKYTASLNPQES